MNVLLRWALFAAASLLFALVVSATAAKTPSRTLKHVSRPIVAVAMDGSRAVYSTDKNAIFVWNVVSGASSQARRATGGGRVPEVAIAGTRVAWITLQVSGNSQETWARLKTASLAGAGRRLVASAYRTDGDSENGVEMWNGNWLTGLVGSGKVLAVSRWTTTDNTISNARLSLIDRKPARLHVIASGLGSIASVSAADGRIAVLRPDGTVGIYSSVGRLLLQISPSSAKEIALGGGRLVVLTQTKTLEVYDSRSGKLLHIWPVYANGAYLQAGHLRAYGRIGIYSVDPRRSIQHLHIVDLTTGKELTLPAAEHPWAADAAVGPIGLVYAINTHRFGSHPKQSGTLVFLSTTRVIAMLARGQAAA